MNLLLVRVKQGQITDTNYKPSRFWNAKFPLKKPLPFCVPTPKWIYWNVMVSNLIPCPPSHPPPPPPPLECYIMYFPLSSHSPGHPPASSSSLFPPHHIPPPTPPAPGMLWYVPSRACRSSCTVYFCTASRNTPHSCSSTAPRAHGRDCRRTMAHSVLSTNVRGRPLTSLPARNEWSFPFKPWKQYIQHYCSSRANKICALIAFITELPGSRW